MKHFFIFLAVVFITASTFAQVGINIETADPSAALDITSTTGGLLVPRMTETQRDAITATQGLIIFCTDCASGEGELQVKLTSIWKSLHDGGEDPVDPEEPQTESESALAYEPDNFVRFNNIPQYDNLSSITVEFWVFKNNHTDEHFIGTEYYDTGWMVNGQHRDTPYTVAKLGVLEVPSSSEVFIPLGEWTHIVLQYDGSLSENNLKFFINGEIKYQESGFPDGIGDGGNIAINRHTWNGSPGYSSRLSGKLDEVRISNIARYSENFTPSTNQLQNDNNTLLLLNFETTSSSSNQVIDSSNFQNHGNVFGEINYTPRN